MAQVTVVAQVQPLAWELPHATGFIKHCKRGVYKTPDRGIQQKGKEPKKKVYVYEPGNHPPSRSYAV